jgi:hypothetical protein
VAAALPPGPRSPPINEPGSRGRWSRRCGVTAGPDPAERQQALPAIGGSAFGAIAEARAGEVDPHGRVGAVIAALLDQVAGEPIFARLAFFERRSGMSSPTAAPAT